MKVGDLVRAKSPFDPEIYLIVDTRKDIGDDCFAVLASNGKFVTHNIRKRSLEVLSASR
jgi:hypothetical protein